MIKGYFCSNLIFDIKIHSKKFSTENKNTALNPYWQYFGIASQWKWNPKNFASIRLNYRWWGSYRWIAHQLLVLISNAWFTFNYRLYHAGYIFTHIFLHSSKPLPKLKLQNLLLTSLAYSIYYFTSIESIITKIYGLKHVVLWNNTNLSINILYISNFRTFSRSRMRSI